MLRVAPALLFVLAGCAGLTDDDTSQDTNDEAPSQGWQAGDPVPALSMTRADVTMSNTGQAAWLFTVTDLSNPPIPYDVVVIKIDGCAWHEQSDRGNVEVSDAILCQAHDVLTLVHAPSGERMYSNCNGCGTPLPPPGATSSDDEPWYQAMDVTTSDGPPTFRVDDVEEGHRWDEFVIRSDQSGLRVALNREADDRSLPIGSSFGRFWESDLRAGDVLHFCTTDATDLFSVRFGVRGTQSWGYSWSSSGVVSCPPGQPTISWSVSQSGASASVASAELGATWDEFTMVFDSAGQLDLNGMHTVEVPSQEPAAMPDASVSGGDDLFFCRHDGPGPLDATLHHVASNQTARTFQFNQVPDC